MLCLLCGDAGVMDFTLNVVLFIPSGLGLALWTAGRLKLAPLALMIAALSLSIEALQATIITGRHAALGDLVANTLGGLIGLSVPGRWRSLVLPPPGRAPMFVALACALGLAVPLGTGLLLRPSPGHTTTWYGQWAHLLGGTVPFEGQVLDVRLDTLRVPRFLLPDQPAYREVWHVPLRFSTQILTGPVANGRAQVAAIADGTGGWVAAIWQDGPDAIMSLRLRTSNLRLRTPWIRLEEALTAPPGSKTTLAVTALPDRIHAVAERVDGRRTTELRLTPNFAWVLLWPWDTAFAAEPVIRTLAWTLGWFVLVSGLVSWWGRVAGSPAVATVMVTVLLVTVQAGIPKLLGTSPSTAWEWLAAVAGTLAGAVIAHVSAREWWSTVPPGSGPRRRTHGG